MKLKQKAVFHELELIQDEFSGNVSQYLDEIIGEGRYQSYLIQIDEVFRVSKRLLKMKMHQSAIKELEDDILAKDYPLKIGIPMIMDKLKADGPGAQSEDLDSTNKFQANLIKKSKRMRDNYDRKIRKKARAMLGRNREKYLTDNSTATAELYKGVHRRLDDIKKGDKVEMKKPSVEFVKKRINELLAKKGL